jgi:hypothetical protein
MNNENIFQFNERLFSLMSDYNRNMNTYNSNIHYIMHNLIPPDEFISPPPSTSTTPSQTTSAGNRVRFQYITELQRYLSTIASSLPPTTPPTPPTTVPTTTETDAPLTPPLTQLQRNRLMDSYLTRILNLVNNGAGSGASSSGAGGNDNDLTISFSIMRELDDVPLFDITTSQHDVTPAIYNRSTILVSYDISNDEMDRICPISHETFEDGEIITKVVGCGHVFKTNNIKRWFERSPCCPKCRYNVVTGQYPNTAEPSRNMFADDAYRAV